MAPQSVARGTPQSGDRAAAGMPDRAKVHVGRQQPATGSHLPAEDTAPPYAVVPFASSPFAHSIPQSRRRASGDLFSASPENQYNTSWSPYSRLPCPCGSYRNMYRQLLIFLFAFLAFLILAAVGVSELLSGAAPTAVSRLSTGFPAEPVRIPVGPSADGDGR